MLVLYLLLTLVGGTAVVWKIVDTQFVTQTYPDDYANKDKAGKTYMWKDKIGRDETRRQTVPARRGNIYSSDGKILSTTVTVCDLYLDLHRSYEFNSNGDTARDSYGRPKQKCPIVDSNFNKYLDTVCLLLSKGTRSNSADYYKQKILSGRNSKGPNRCFPVARHVPYPTWLAITRLPGWRAGVVHEVRERVGGRDTIKSVIYDERAPIYDNMAMNTMGFDNGRDNKTYTGLEGAYDSILRGHDGYITYRRLTRRVWKSDMPGEEGEKIVRSDGDKVDTMTLERKVDGESIVATIDTRYQDIAEHALRNALSQFGGLRGCAILMEVETGYVLACANLAVDSSGRFREVRDENVAVSRYYEPGSTFKSVAMMAMLNDPKQTIDTSMQVRAFYKEFPFAKPVKDSHKKRDSLSVKEVIEESSNVGMCELAWMYFRNRRDDFVKSIRQVFPYEKLNLDVNAPEPPSYINNVHASNNDFLRLSFGYSTAVTPMQIITFYNAVAGGGRMVKPLFCRAIVDRNGKRREIAPVVLREQAFSRENAKKLTDMLVGVVDRGTARGIKSELYSIAGKTGTANYRVSMPEWHNSSFAGFFPADKPRYTCYVMLEKVPRVAFGTQAAKVFKEIANCVVAIDSRLNEGVLAQSLPQLEKDSTKARELPYLEKGRQEGISRAFALVGRRYVGNNLGSEWVSFRSATDTTEASYVEYKPAHGRVPNCYGMSAKDAVWLLKQQGYRVRVKGFGKVKGQSPKAGTNAKKGVTVVLDLK